MNAIERLENFEISIPKESGSNEFDQDIVVSVEFKTENELLNDIILPYKTGEKEIVLQEGVLRDFEADYTYRGPYYTTKGPVKTDVFHGEAVVIFHRKRGAVDYEVRMKAYHDHGKIVKGVIEFWSKRKKESTDQYDQKILRTIILDLKDPYFHPDGTFDVANPNTFKEKRFVTLFDEDGNKTFYTGSLDKHGRPHGKGKLTEEGAETEGEFKHGIIYTGEKVFLNNEPTQKWENGNRAYNCLFCQKKGCTGNLQDFKNHLKKLKCSKNKTKDLLNKWNYKHKIEEKKYKKNKK